MRSNKNSQTNNLDDGCWCHENQKKWKHKIKLDDFSGSKEVEWKFHVDESGVSNHSLGYDVIISLNLMCELGLIVNYKTKVVEWDGTKIPITSKTTQLNRK